MIWVSRHKTAATHFISHFTSASEVTTIWRYTNVYIIIIIIIGMDIKLWNWEDRLVELLSTIILMT